MEFIHDKEGNLVMHVDAVSGIFIGSVFEPKHMSSNDERQAEIFDGTQFWEGYTFLGGLYG